MNYQAAQNDLASTIKASASRVTKPFFWRLSGNEASSFCRFLGVTENELITILRLCRVFHYEGEKEIFCNNNFELLMMRAACDWTTYKLNGKAERFVLIGDGNEVVLPKDMMYDPDGILTCYPLEDEHIFAMRTKSKRGLVPQLLDAAQVKETLETSKEPRKQADNRQKDQSLPKDLLLGYVEELVGRDYVEHRCTSPRDVALFSQDFRQLSW